jgi:pantothenate kinase
MNWIVVVYHIRALHRIVVVDGFHIVVFRRHLIFLHREVWFLSLPLRLVDHLHQFKCHFAVDGESSKIWLFRRHLVFRRHLSH